MTLVQSQEVATILAVNADAAPLGNVADNTFRWHGAATAGEITHEIANAGHSGSPAIATLLPGPSWSDLVGYLGTTNVLQGRGDCRGSQIAGTQRHA